MYQNLKFISSLQKPVTQSCLDAGSSMRGMRESLIYGHDESRGDYFLTIPSAIDDL